MNVLTDPFTPLNYPDLFTLMWVAGILISLGAIVVDQFEEQVDGLGGSHIGFSLARDAVSVR